MLKTGGPIPPLVVSGHAAGRLKQRTIDQEAEGPFYEHMDPHERWFLKSSIQRGKHEGLALTPDEWNRVAGLFYLRPLSAVDRGWCVFDGSKCYIVAQDRNNPHGMVVKTTIHPNPEQRTAILAILTHPQRSPTVLPFGAPPYPAAWPCEVAVLNPLSLLQDSASWMRVRSWVRRAHVTKTPADIKLWFTPEFRSAVSLLQTAVGENPREILQSKRRQSSARTSFRDGCTLILATEHNVSSVLRGLHPDTIGALQATPTANRSSRFSAGQVLAFRERPPRGIECHRFSL